MMLMAMRILFARTIMVIIRLAGDDQNFSRTLMIMMISFFSRTLMIMMIPFFSRTLMIMMIPFFFKDPGDYDHLYVWEEQQGTQESFWRLESCS